MTISQQVLPLDSTIPAVNYKRPNKMLGSESSQEDSSFLRKFVKHLYYLEQLKTCHPWHTVISYDKIHLNNL